jgi:preprotein translocase subunit YajC
MRKFSLSAFVFGLISLDVALAQQTAATPAPKGDWSPILGIVLMFAVFFFLIILPQSRRAKKQAQFLSQLQKGDNIVTQAGIYGKIVGLADKVVTLEIAPNVKIRVDRQTIVGKDEFSNETKVA